MGPPGRASQGGIARALETSSHDSSDGQAERDEPSGRPVEHWQPDSELPSYFSSLGRSRLKMLNRPSGIESVRVVNAVP